MEAINKQLHNFLTKINNEEMEAKGKMAAMFNPMDLSKLNSRFK